MNNSDIAAAFFDALAREDKVKLRQVCAPDFRPQQNGGPTLTIEELLGFATAIHRVVRGFEYGDPVLAGTTTGFVQEHRVRGTLPDGTAVDMPVCVVGDVIDGRITAAREYFDTARAAKVLVALG